MAMLGFLHRIVLGDVTNQIAELFPFAPAVPGERMETRLLVRRHSMQFVEPEFHTDVLKRSLFGLTVIYNLLPAFVAAANSVTNSHSNLQKALRNAVVRGLPDWPSLFSPTNRSVRASVFQ